MRIGVLVVLLFGVCGWAGAASVPVPAVPPPPGIAAKSYVLMDADTDRIIAGQNSDEPLHPASLTKIMTGFIAAGEVASGRISLADEVLVSVEAWRTPGSRMFIQEGTRVSVADLLRGIIVQSGNDASVALAEHIAGSEGAFADMMNRQADELGLTATQFRNSTGLPADDHYTSARDLAVLTRNTSIGFRRTTPSMRSGRSSTTRSSSRIATACSTVTVPSMESRPAIPMPPATAWWHRRSGRACG